MTIISPLEFPEKTRDGDHLVQFYLSDQFLIESVINFIAPALMNGEGVFLIATENHLYEFEKTLQDLRINTSLLKLSGQLVLLDAELTLKKLMVSGLPDNKKFNDSIINIIIEMDSKFPRVKAYAEMVNVLWNEGNALGSVALEKLWCDALLLKKFTLLCGYSLESICEDKQGVVFKEVCRCHSHIIPAEGIIESETSFEQLINIIELQYASVKKDKQIHDSKLNSLEMMIPLTALNIQLRELKNITVEDQISTIVHKCEDQITKMRIIIEGLSK